MKELDEDIKSNSRMFRLIQGDVGSGKTILALILAAKVSKSNYQVAYMAPTEILSKQQYEQTKNLFNLTASFSVVKISFFKLFSLLCFNKIFLTSFDV